MASINLNLIVKKYFFENFLDNPMHHVLIKNSFQRLINFYFMFKISLFKNIFNFS